jgi:hypothetical protein
MPICYVNRYPEVISSPRPSQYELVAGRGSFGNPASSFDSDSNTAAMVEVYVFDPGTAYGMILKGFPSVIVKTVNLNLLIYYKLHNAGGSGSIAIDYSWDNSTWKSLSGVSVGSFYNQEISNGTATNYVYSLVVPENSDLSNLRVRIISGTSSCGLSLRIYDVFVAIT